MFNFFIKSSKRSYALYFPIFLLLSLVILGWSHKKIVQGGNQFHITGSENHSISLADAVNLTRNYRNSVPPGTILAEAFGKDAIQGIINQPECAGIRIYYGKKDNGSPVLLMVGINSSGTDLADGKLAETGFPCPPFCEDLGPLSH